MKIIRFILPFLFERNWYTGAWELSRPRFIIFCIVAGLLLVGILIACILQLPLTYDTTSV